jgi:hypothetical protein
MVADRQVDTYGQRPDVGSMISAFTRIMLALAMAFVFAGQMEAAAAHCARLAQADSVAVELPAAEIPDCHGMAEDAAAPAHHQTPQHAPEDQSTPADHCDCIGALKVCAAPAALPRSSSIAAYAWQAPQAISFASVEPAPARRPPRA